MRHRTSSLKGALLDAAVERIEAARYGMAVGPGHIVSQWHKSWAVGGPIIDRERIDFRCGPAGEDVVASIVNGRGTFIGIGPTHLVAAMRCFATSKLGQSVDL